MVSYGTGTQQKTVSWPLTIHPSWCTGGHWFALARTPSCLAQLGSGAYYIYNFHSEFFIKNLLFDIILINEASVLESFF